LSEGLEVGEVLLHINVHGVATAATQLQITISFPSGVEIKKNVLLKMTGEKEIPTFSIS